MLCNFFFFILSIDSDFALPPLPEGAEAWFVLPRWQAVAGNYIAAVQHALHRLAEQRKFWVCRPRLINMSLTRQPRLEKFLKIISEQQRGHNLLIVPCQFGTKHRGMSVRDSREAFPPAEFGLGVFEVACMLLTHPERLVDSNSLSVDCCGEVCTPGDCFRLCTVPHFTFYVSGLCLDNSLSTYEDRGFGSVTGFLAQ